MRLADDEFRNKVADMIVDIKWGADSLQKSINRNDDMLPNEKEMRRVYYAAKRIVKMFEEAG